MLAPVPVSVTHHNMTPLTREILDYRKGFADGCYVNGEKTCVAQPKDYCNEGSFGSSHYVRANGGHPLRYCAGRLQDVVIGRCGDSSKCSNSMERCKDPSSFAALDPSCTVVLDLSDDGAAPVTYGKCGDRCVWSSEDCLPGKAYLCDDPACMTDRV